MKIGFVGTGTITSAVVAGLLGKKPQLEIAVTRRSETFSAPLAGRFPSVQRLDSGGDVVAWADVVFLAVRPAQVEEALAGIGFRPGQHLISLVAGLPIAELERLAPGCTITRVIPLPAIARGTGPIIAYPQTMLVKDLFSGLGDLIEARSEAELVTLTSLSAFMSSYFTLQNSLIEWTSNEGVCREDAARLVQSMFSSLAETARRTPLDQLGSLPKQHETPGGLNETIRRQLAAQGWFESPHASLSAVRGLTRSELE